MNNKCCVLNTTNFKSDLILDKNTGATLKFDLAGLVPPFDPIYSGIWRPIFYNQKMLDTWKVATSLSPISDYREFVNPHDTGIYYASKYPDEEDTDYNYYTTTNVREDKNPIPVTEIPENTDADLGYHPLGIGKKQNECVTKFQNNLLGHKDCVNIPALLFKHWNVQGLSSEVNWSIPYSLDPPSDSGVYYSFPTGIATEVWDREFVDNYDSFYSLSESEEDFSIQNFRPKEENYFVQEDRPNKNGKILFVNPQSRVVNISVSIGGSIGPDITQEEILKMFTASVGGNQINWIFEGNTNLFNYLSISESLSLTYGISTEWTDPDTEIKYFRSYPVNIFVIGNNDKIAIEQDDTPSLTLDQSNNLEPLSGFGLITVYDPDISDQVSWVVKEVKVTGSKEGLKSTEQQLKNMLFFDTALLKDSNISRKFLKWYFFSGSESFSYLSKGQTLSLQYIIDITDSRDNDTLKSSITINKTITIRGSDDKAYGGVFEVDDSSGGLYNLNDPKPLFGTISYSDIDYTEGAPQVKVYSVVRDLYHYEILPIPLSPEEDIAKNWLSVSASQTEEVNFGKITWNFTPGYLEAMSGKSRARLYYIIQIGPDDNCTFSTITIDIIGKNYEFEIDDQSIFVNIEPNKPTVIKETIVLTDLNINDYIYAFFDYYTVESNNEDLAKYAFNISKFGQMLTFRSVLPMTGTTMKQVEYTFNSLGDPFKYLGPNDTLTVKYNTYFTDSFGFSKNIKFIVTITKNTNHKPLIYQVSVPDINLSDSNNYEYPNIRYYVKDFNLSDIVTVSLKNIRTEGNLPPGVTEQKLATGVKITSSYENATGATGDPKPGQPYGSTPQLPTTPIVAINNNETTGWFDFQILPWSYNIFDPSWENPYIAFIRSLNQNDEDIGQYLFSSYGSFTAIYEIEILDSIGDSILVEFKYTFGKKLCPSYNFEDYILCWYRYYDKDRLNDTRYKKGVDFFIGDIDFIVLNNEPKLSSYISDQNKKNYHIDLYNEVHKNLLDHGYEDPVASLQAAIYCSGPQIDRVTEILSSPDHYQYNRIAAWPSMPKNSTILSMSDGLISPTLYQMSLKDYDSVLDDRFCSTEYEIIRRLVDKFGIKFFIESDDQATIVSKFTLPGSELTSSDIKIYSDTNPVIADNFFGKGNRVDDNFLLNTLLYRKDENLSAGFDMNITVGNIAFDIKKINQKISPMSLTNYDDFTKVLWHINNLLPEEIEETEENDGYKRTENDYKIYTNYLLDVYELSLIESSNKQKEIITHFIIDSERGVFDKFYLDRPNGIEFHNDGGIAINMDEHFDIDSNILDFNDVNFGKISTSLPLQDREWLTPRDLVRFDDNVYISPFVGKNPPTAFFMRNYEGATSQSNLIQLTIKSHPNTRVQLPDNIYIEKLRSNILDNQKCCSTFSRLSSQKKLAWHNINTFQLMNGGYETRYTSDTFEPNVSTFNIPNSFYYGDLTLTQKNELKLDLPNHPAPLTPIPKTHDKNNLFWFGARFYENSNLQKYFTYFQTVSFFDRLAGYSAFDQLDPVRLYVPVYDFRDGSEPVVYPDYTSPPLGRSVLSFKTIPLITIEHIGSLKFSVNIPISGKISWTFTMPTECYNKTKVFFSTSTFTKTDVLNDLEDNYIYKDTNNTEALEIEIETDLEDPWYLEINLLPDRPFLHHMFTRPSIEGNMGFVHPNSGLTYEPQYFWKSSMIPPTFVDNSLQGYENFNTSLIAPIFNDTERYICYDNIVLNNTNFLTGLTYIFDTTNLDSNTITAINNANTIGFELGNNHIITRDFVKKNYNHIDSPLYDQIKMSYIDIDYSFGYPFNDFYYTIPDPNQRNIITINSFSDPTNMRAIAYLDVAKYRESDKQVFNIGTGINYTNNGSFFTDPIKLYYNNQPYIVRANNINKNIVTLDKIVPPDLPNSGPIKKYLNKESVLIYRSSADSNANIGRWGNISSGPNLPYDISVQNYSGVILKNDVTIEEKNPNKISEYIWHNNSILRSSIGFDSSLFWGARACVFNQNPNGVVISSGFYTPTTYLTNYFDNNNTRYLSTAGADIPGFIFSQRDNINQNYLGNNLIGHSIGSEPISLYIGSYDQQINIIARSTPQYSDTIYDMGVDNNIYRTKIDFKNNTEFNQRNSNPKCSGEYVILHDKINKSPVFTKNNNEPQFVDIIYRPPKRYNGIPYDIEDASLYNEMTTYHDEPAYNYLYIEYFYRNTVYTPPYYRNKTVFYSYVDNFEPDYEKLLLHNRTNYYLHDQPQLSPNQYTGPIGVTRSMVDQYILDKKISPLYVNFDILRDMQQHKYQFLDMHVFGSNPDPFNKNIPSPFTSGNIYFERHLQQKTEDYGNNAQLPYHPYNDNLFWVDIANNAQLGILTSTNKIMWQNTDYIILKSLQYKCNGPADRIFKTLYKKDPCKNTYDLSQEDMLSVLGIEDSVAEEFLDIETFRLPDRCNDLCCNPEDSDCEEIIANCQEYFKTIVKVIGEDAITCEPIEESNEATIQKESIEYYIVRLKNNIDFEKNPLITTKNKFRYMNIDYDAHENSTTKKFNDIYTSDLFAPPIHMPQKMILASENPHFIPITATQGFHTYRYGLNNLNYIQESCFIDKEDGMGNIFPNDQTASSFDTMKDLNDPNNYLLLDNHESLILMNEMNYRNTIHPTGCLTSNPLWEYDRQATTNYCYSQDIHLFTCNETDPTSMVFKYPCVEEGKLADITIRHGDENYRFALSLELLDDNIPYIQIDSSLGNKKLGLYNNRGSVSQSQTKYSGDFKCYFTLDDEENRIPNPPKDSTFNCDELIDHLDANILYCKEIPCLDFNNDMALCETITKECRYCDGCTQTTYTWTGEIEVPEFNSPAVNPAIFLYPENIKKCAGNVSHSCEAEVKEWVQGAYDFATKCTPIHSRLYNAKKSIEANVRDYESDSIVTIEKSYRYVIYKLNDESDPGCYSFYAPLLASDDEFLPFVQEQSSKCCSTGIKLDLHINIYQKNGFLTIVFTSFNHNGVLISEARYNIIDTRIANNEDIPDDIYYFDPPHITLDIINKNILIKDMVDVVESRYHVGIVDYEIPANGD